MRVIALALLLLGTVSAFSGGVMAYTMTFGKSAVCVVPDDSDSSDSLGSEPAVFQDIFWSRIAKARAVR